MAFIVTESTTESTSESTVEPTAQAAGRDAWAEDGEAPPDSDAAIVRTLEVLGDRWSILIVRAGLRGLRRFEEFRSDLGIARPILTARLRRLVDHGIMDKVPYQDHPIRYEYRLTDAGVALSPVLVALTRWVECHVPVAEVTTTLVHAPCGTELEQAFWCTTCATTFGPTAIRGVHR